MLTNVKEKTRFWTSSIKGETGTFATMGSGFELNSTSFAMLDVETSSIAKDRCFSMHFSSARKIFVGKHDSCSQMHYPLCYSLPLNASLCEYIVETNNNVGGRGQASEEGQPNEGGQPSEGQPSEGGHPSEGGPSETGRPSDNERPSEEGMV